MLQRYFPARKEKECIVKQAFIIVLEVLVFVYEFFIGKIPS